MNDIKVLNAIDGLLSKNNKYANELRQDLKRNKIFFVNLMSSVGSGKTSLIEQVILRLKDKYNIGVMNASINSDIDSNRIKNSGVNSISLHSKDKCYLDAIMVRHGMEVLVDDKTDFVILENVGDFVCPAKFDTGACKNIMILSVPEGHDKALKYPLMFQVCDALIINKMDVIPYFDFDIKKALEYAEALNPKLDIFFTCATTGEGVDTFTDWLVKQIQNWKSE